MRAKKEFDVCNGCIHLRYGPGPDSNCFLCERCPEGNGSAGDLWTDGKQTPEFENHDAVNHPEHYTYNGIECIQVIRAVLGKYYKYYVIGNVIKYLWRQGHKNGDEDIRKAHWYLTDLIKKMDKEKTKK